ncbi:MAG: molybdenum cofactor guanylyltransferase [Deltaproteobacteria bacterium]|nr:molybdenum cofactor guanylyltransferase [Deltaproteobacteria bacterium]MBZ0219691.1 molybdenum cofactor guanylyltransferase [Deltaproteobacteria bacterium]
MTGAILAGGQSRRMGFNKAFIDTPQGTIIERTVLVVESIFDPVFIIANDIALYGGLGPLVHEDIIKGAGSLGGIYTALYRSESEHAFVTACDMPHLDAGCLMAVAERASEADCVIPFIGGMLHPMHAAYSKRCMSAIEEMVRAGNLRINDLFGKVDTVRLTEKDFPGLDISKSVENVNTRDDLKRAGIDEK